MRKLVKDLQSDDIVITKGKNKVHILSNKNGIITFHNLNNGYVKTIKVDINKFVEVVAYGTRLFVIERN